MISVSQPASPDPAVVPLPPAAPPSRLLRLVLAHIDHAVCLLDPADRIVLWNDAYLRFFPEEADILRPGLPYAETLRRFCETNLPVEELPFIDRHIEAGLVRHRSDHIPYVYQIKDGRWFRVETCRLEDDSRLKFWTDVTAEQTLLAQKAKHDSTMVALDIGFARFDAAGQFLMANRALADLFPDCIDLFRSGVSWRDHLRRHAEATFAAEERPRLQRLLDRDHPALAPVDRPMVLRRCDGGWLQLEERIAEDGGLFATWIDVTQRLRSEIELATVRNQLLEAIGSMSEGFALFDADDAVALCNEKFRGLIGNPCRPGTPYVTILRSAAESGHFAGAAGRIEEWLAEQMARHRSPGRPGEERLAGGRWVRIAERRTADGGTVSVVSDITQQKRREDELVARSVQLETAVDSMAALTDAIVHTARDGIVTFARSSLCIASFNPAAERIFGREAQAVIGRPVTLLLDVADADGAAEGAGPALPPGLIGREEAEARGRRADGTVFDMEVSIAETGTGDDAFYTAIFRDITGRKRAERALRESEQRFRELIEGSIQGILIHRDFRPLFANEAYARIVGFASVEEVLALPSIKPLIPPEQWPAADDAYAALIRGERQHGRKRVSSLRPDGTEFWLDLADRAVNWLGEPAVQVTVVDVTSQVLAEARAAEKSAQLETAFDAMPNGICMFGADLRVVIYNRRYAELWGLSESFLAQRPTLPELVRCSIARGDDGDDDGGDPESKVAEEVARLRGDAPLYGIRRLVTGRILEVQGNRRPDGGFVYTYLDITDRKRAEAEIARKTAILEATLENMGQGICMVDGEARLLAANRRLAELYGIPPDVVRGFERFADMIRYTAERGEYGPVDVDQVVRERAGFAVRMDPLIYEHRRPNGTVIEIVTTPMPDGGFVRTFTDITARKQSEAELRAAKERAEAALGDLRKAQDSLIQAEKMASLGQLVAGVAHEINTPIGITLTAATHLGEETRSLRALFGEGRLRQSQFRAYLDLASETTRLMVGNIERAAGLIQSFKQVAVDQTSAERRRFDLRDYLHEVLLSLHPRLKKTALQVTVTCPEGLEMDGYPGALSQVLSNLVINSLVHGYDDGQAGRITITVTPLAPDGAAEQVELRYADDGRGIPAKHLPKIFDPFYTTRRGAGGSGLGLHIVYNLVTRTLHGSIAVDGGEGSGAVFTIRLPRVVPPSEPAAVAAPAAEAADSIGSQEGRGSSDDADR